MAAPLYRTTKTTVAELDYEHRKNAWLQKFGGLLRHVLNDPAKQKQRIKNVVLTKIRIFEQRIANLVKRRDNGDKDVVIPDPVPLMQLLYGELAGI